MMPAPTTHFSLLFSQLGLLDDPANIAAFLRQHTPLTPGLRLHEAPFWSDSQACFLREALLQDSEWAVPADQLAQALQPPDPDAATSVTESG
jgi:Protein of unknown function (DUF2789)